jgi:hypothetical protein
MSRKGKGIDDKQAGVVAYLQPAANPPRLRVRSKAGALQHRFRYWSLYSR